MSSGGCSVEQFCIKIHKSLVKEFKWCTRCIRYQFKEPVRGTVVDLRVHDMCAQCARVGLLGEVSASTRWPRASPPRRGRRPNRQKVCSSKFHVSIRMHVC